MTFSLRKKRLTIVRATTTRTTTACKWLAVLLLVAGFGIAQADEMPGQVRSTLILRDGATPGAPSNEKRTLPAPNKPTTIIQVQGGGPPMLPPKSSGAESVYVRLDPPGRDKLFGTRETEKQLEERMRQEAKDAGLVDSVVFPKTEPFTEPFKPRQFVPMIAVIEPSYVVYQRLYFEEKNAERNAWNLGFFQPAISSAYFFKDVIFLPHAFASNICRRFETNAGECWPGNSLPYMCYPPEFTMSGSAFEAAVILGAIAIAP